MQEGYGKRALVLGDDEDVRHLLAAVLMQASYNVYEACTDREAFEQMTKRRYDVVITDYRMRHLDGMQFLLYSRTAWPETPVIIVSGEQPERADLAVVQDTRAWIRKPFNVEELLREVRIVTASREYPSIKVAPQWEGVTTSV